MGLFSNELQLNLGRHVQASVSCMPNNFVQNQDKNMLGYMPSPLHDNHTW